MRLHNLIFAVVMGFLMSLCITFVTTLARLGPGPDFIIQWLSTWMIAYPVAILCIPLFRPLAASATDFLAQKIKKNLG